MDFHKEIVSELERLKITDIKFYDLANRSILADYFILSTADNVIQLESAKKKINEMMKRHHILLKNPMEEYEGGWLLLDYGNTIVHVFTEELRQFYDLDSILDHFETDVAHKTDETIDLSKETLIKLRAAE